MKKFLIIFAIIFSINNANAITIDEIVSKAKKFVLEENKKTKPVFSLIDMNGKVHTNKSTDGKYLVVNFWATWCPPCRKEMPDFVKFYEKNQDKVLIIGMDYEKNNKADTIDFLDSYMVDYPIILFNEKNETQFEKFGEILGMPTTLIYSPDGKLIDYHQGVMNIKDLQQATNL